MRQPFFLLAILLTSVTAKAQFIRCAPAGDTTRTITLEGYADVYFGFDFNEPKEAGRPYFVSHARHKETNLNLAYLSIKYSSRRARATFTPGFGTYMNANYAAEHTTLRNIVEASIGVRPFKKRNIWIDAGIFSAPYTTESAVAHDQLIYTRSFGAEYSPYYLSGIKATLPLSAKISLYLYLVNGWQVIEDVNAPLSFGSALEWKPNDKTTLSWSTYAGDEKSALQPQYEGRYFSDLYLLYAPNKRLSISADIYAGRQRLTDSIINHQKNRASWYQANLNGRLYLSGSQSVAVRVEYFRDAHAVLVVPVTGLRRFDCGSVSLGYNIAVTDEVTFHTEGRYFVSGGEVFFDRDGQPTSNSGLLIGGLTAKF